MKVDLNEVIEMNSKILGRYVPGVTDNDSLMSKQEKSKGIITISDKSPDAKSITVRFLTNLVVAVADNNPDEEAVRNALSSIVPTAVAAGKSGTVVNGLTVFGDLANATREILKVKQNSDPIPFIVPVQTKPGCSYSIKTTVKGTSLTTDSGEDFEKANVTSSVKFLDQESKDVIVRNEGTKTTKLVSLVSQLKNVRAPDSRSDARAIVTPVLKTDGRVFSATISAVNITLVEIDLTEVCNNEIVIDEKLGSDKLKNPKVDTKKTQIKKKGAATLKKKRSR